MSQQEYTHSSTESDFISQSELFQNLEQEFQAIWNQNAPITPSFTASVSPSVHSTAHTQAPRARRKSKSADPLKAAPGLKSRRTARAPLINSGLQSAAPVRHEKTALRQQLRRKRQQQQNRFKVASIGVAALATGLIAFQSVQNYFSSQEPSSLEQAMYQNASSKVAAFRKEIEQGEHFIPEADRPIEYIAQEGDTVLKISQKFHVSPNTIIKNNVPSKVNDIIEPGTKLSILPVDGIAHPVAKSETIAELSKRYKVGIQEILDANQLENPHMIAEKQRIIIPNATELKHRPKPVMQAIKDAQRTGSNASLAKTPTGRRLSWPAAGIVSSGFGWRWFRMHNGLDIAGPVGTSIKAVKEGRVVYSGWMGGYGYCIDIDHGNGITTRYGHNSSLNVQVGQYVARGQVIAAMGSTGHSTGPHLHFEVHVNGSPVDPRGHF